MKPAFALSLSSDGIALLHRASDGWRSVAETPFDTGDLPAALADMREDAMRLEPDGIFSKLILPNDQIRYLSAETGNLALEERIEAARHALEGATPYAVAELAFDILPAGRVTHIAAVALETLDEAETFAVEHGFGPVSFVAVPASSDFPGEPFFGTTRAIRGTEVEPDNAVVSIVGPAELPPPSEQEAPDTEVPPLLAVEPEAAEELPFETDMHAGLTGPDLQSGNNAPLKVPPAPPVTAEPAPAASQQEITPESPENTSSKDKTISPASVPELAPVILTATAEPVAAPPEAKLLGPARSEGPSQSTVIPPAPAALRKQPQTGPSSEEAQTNETPKSAPRRKGVFLSVCLLLLLAAFAIWAFYGEDGLLASRPGEETELPVTAPLPLESTDAHPAQLEEHAATDSSGPEEDAPAISPQVSVLADQPDPGIEDIGTSGSEQATLSEPATEVSGSVSEPSIADEATADGVELPEEGTETAFLDPDSLQPAGAEPALPAPLQDSSPQDEIADAALYAATGVWTAPPELDSIPASTGLDELYTASIDQNGASPDAVALPRPGTFTIDSELEAIASPAAAGAAFDLDERGLVKATPEGTLNPDGITVYLGRPKVVPPPAPERSDPEAEALAETIARNQVLSRKRPKARPANLAEQVERSQLGGLSRAELASLRPRMRPASVKPAEEELLPATAQAIAASVVPRGRPANFANLVDRAQRNPQNQVQTAAAAPAAAATAPRIPTSASVARRATVSGAINLRKLNLIGVFGTASDRRALVRLPSGRYKKVQVGDRIDGGKVIAIGENQLQYQKGGRNRTLTMPKG